MGFRFNLADSLIAAREGERAEEQLRFILGRHPDTPLAWDRIGDVALLRQDPEAAASAWRQAFALGTGIHQA